MLVIISGDRARPLAELLSADSVVCLTGVLRIQSGRTARSTTESLLEMAAHQISLRQPG